jgi:hypothetical protein
MAEGHGLHVEFYVDSKLMGFLSEQAGRPIHQDAEFIKIMIPGDKNTIHEREATDQDRDRFPLEYARFKNGMNEEMQAVGTPLKAWPAMSRSLVKDFAHFNVHTVEQLSNMSDTAMQAFGMGAREYATKAKAFLALAADSAAGEKYAVENEELKQQIANLQSQFAELSAKVDPEKRGPGRPRTTNAVKELVEPL